VRGYRKEDLADPPKNEAERAALRLAVNLDLERVRKQPRRVSYLLACQRT
jgi:hypothetical protein